jgi:hypothetical protein
LNSFRSIWMEGLELSIIFIPTDPGATGISELVWKIWTSQKAVLSDKLLGSRRYLTPLAGSPINHIRRPIVKSLMRPLPIVELEINS